MKRLLICDDQEIVCAGLQRILETDPQLSIAGIAHNGEEAVELAASLKPDLVLMDLQMPVMNGVQAIRRIRVSQPKLPILVLTTYTDDKWLFDALHEGASGYLLKDRPRDELIAAIKGTLEGNNYLDPAITGRVMQSVLHQPAPIQADNFDLNEREREILKLLSAGLSNSEIASRLYLSDGTVRNYLSGIFNKLGVTDRTQAVIIALRSGIVPFEGAE